MAVTESLQNSPQTSGDDPMVILVVGDVPAAPTGGNAPRVYTGKPVPTHRLALAAPASELAVIAAAFRGRR